MKLTPEQVEAMKVIAEGRFFPDMVKEKDGWHARWRAVGKANPWVDVGVRRASMTPLSADAENQRHASLHDAWLAGLKSRTGLVRWDDAECAEFAGVLKKWHREGDDGAAARREIEFRLVSDKDAAQADAQASDAAVLDINGRFRLECDIPRGEAALEALGQAADVFGSLRTLRRRAASDGAAGWADGVLSCPLARHEVEAFLRTGVRDLEAAGYNVSLPEFAAKVDAVAEINPPGDAPAPGGGLPPETTCALTLTVRVNGEPVTAEEIRFMLEQGSSLVFFRDRWIEVDRDILKEALRALERRDRQVSSPLGFVMGVGAVGRLEIAEIAAGGWLRGLVNELRGASGRGVAEDFAVSVGLKAELRGYQRRGVRWIKFLTDHGFGALLADDMGLGKTIQTIAWLLSIREVKAGEKLPPSLIVAPLTLLANWKHELAKFAPGLKVYVHQGENRRTAAGFRRVAGEADVVLTSYNLLVRDHALFADLVWQALVTDEAQALKNPETQAARAVRALLPPRRLALTGTPIENTVADVWALEDFLNPGFLGERKSFEERFVKPLRNDPLATVGKRLRHALEPFVLRRLKSDDEIAAELGAKREIKEYCRLADGQRNEYESALADYRSSARKQGDVFSLLTRLKLICDGEGKLERLFELLEQIFESGESALVFTQYAKIGKWLQREINARFEADTPFLHGGISASERERQIARFNAAGPSAFILSLKAGGYGLNLVKATHVIHFDRWWNPAVENQATDRVYRIGQSRTVFVHCFITAGTLEEHIDDILERKSTLEGLLVAGEEFERMIGLE